MRSFYQRRLSLFVAAAACLLTACESTPPSSTQEPRLTQTQKPDGTITATAADDPGPAVPVPVTPAERSETVIPGEAPQTTRKLTPSQLRSRVRSFADQYRTEIGKACDEIMQLRADEPDLKRRALQYKINGTTAMYDIAVDPVPQQALLDMLVLVTLQWYAAESHLHTQFPKDHPLIRESARIVKDSGWTLAAQVIEERQRRDLLAIIDRWWQDHGEESDIWYVRISDFQGYTRGTTFEGAIGAVAGLPGKVLNAFVPLSSASETLDEASDTAERAAWLAPRMLILAQWRAEALIFDTLAATEIDQVIETAEKAVRVAERATSLAETLPEEVRTQSEALLDDIAENQESISALLAEARATVESINSVAEASRSVVSESDQTLRTADDLVRSVDRLLVTWNEMQQNKEPQTQEGRPFDIVNYTQALNAANATLQETNAVLANLQSATEPQILRARFDEVTSSGEDFVSHLTARLERLVIITGVTIAAAGILIVIAAKLIPSRKRVKREGTRAFAS